MAKAGTDPATEERINEMIEIEEQLIDRYNEIAAGSSDSDSDSDSDGTEEEDDAPQDDRLGKYTGRIVSFESRWRDPSPDRDSDPDSIAFTIVCEDGGTILRTVPFPEDPTDETEPLVRLCHYLDVPIKMVSELQGEYVPLDPDRFSLSIDIPPVPAPGNNLIYRTKRAYRTNKIVRGAMKGAGISVWMPLFGMLPPASALPAGEGFLPLLGFIAHLFAVAIPMIISMLCFAYVLLEGIVHILSRGYILIRNGMFPSAPEE